MGERAGSLVKVASIGIHFLLLDLTVDSVDRDISHTARHSDLNHGAETNSPT